MNRADRELAAKSWRASMAALYERRTGPRKVALDPELVPATRWIPLGTREQAAARHDRFDALSRTRAAPRERRGDRLRAGDAALALDRDEEADVRAAHEDLPRSPRAIRSQAALRHHAHARLGARAGEEGRRGDRRGQVSRSAARHSLGREGPARYRGDPDDVRRRAVSQSRAHGGRRRGEAAQRRRRRARRQAEPRRARAQRHLVRRPDDESVAARGGIVRLERGPGRGDRRRAGGVRDRQRNAGEHHQSVDALRRHGTASDVRPRAAHRRDDALLDAATSSGRWRAASRTRCSCFTRSRAPTPAISRACRHRSTSTPAPR